MKNPCYGVAGIFFVWGGTAFIIEMASCTEGIADGGLEMASDTEGMAGEGVEMASDTE
jgi:hypothetical protein